jgi:hypothetical protein
MRRLIPVVTAVLVLVACGGQSPSRTDRPRDAPPDEVVVRVVTRGGFAAESRPPAQLPQLSVFGDGRVITQGPTTLEYPGPALPNLQEFRLSGDGLARIVSEARAAGLLDAEPPDYGDPGVTDQATTTVTVRADGTTRQVEVYALGFKGRVSGVTPEHMENRRRLEQFIQRAGDSDALGDAVVPGSTRRYEPEALAVRIEPFLADLETERRDWPLGDLAGTECAVVAGGDLAAVLDAARTAREDVRWLSGNESYRLVFRPLLPDEHTCDDVSA